MNKKSILIGFALFAVGFLGAAAAVYFAMGREARLSARPPAASGIPKVEYNEYKVGEGEDIISVAIIFGVEPHTIRELNGLGEDEYLRPGMVIRLPAEMMD